MTSLSHHVEASALDLKDECLHIAAARIITDEIDIVLEVSPSMDFSGKYLHFYTPFGP